MQRQLHPAWRGSWRVPITGAGMLVSRQRKGRGEGLSHTHFKGVLSKNATEGGSSCALNCDEHKTVLALLLLSSGLSRTVLQPSIVHCQPFRKLTKRCCCVILAHHVKSLPLSQPWTTQTLHSALPINLPIHTGFPLRFFLLLPSHTPSFCVFPFLTKTGFQLMFASRMVYPPQCGARQGHGPHFLP